MKRELKQLLFKTSSKRVDLATILISIMLLTGLSVDLAPVSTSEIESIFGSEAYLTSLGRFIMSFPDKISSFLLLVLLPLVFLLLRFFLFNRKSNKRLIAAFVFGFVGSATFVLGRAIETEGDLSFLIDGGVQLAKTGYCFAAYMLIISAAVFLLFTILDEITVKNAINKPIILQSRLGIFFDRYPVAFGTLSCFILWAPLLIAYYPGLFMGDTGGQINQWFNYPDYTSNYLDLIDENVLLNSHHPVLHTALMGGCVQIGYSLFGSYNVGYFIYTGIQYTLVCLTIGYAMRALKDFEITVFLRVGVLVFCLVFPAISNYALLGTKDTLFACCALILFLNVVRLLKNDFAMSKSNWLITILSLLGFLFLRNGTTLIIAVLMVLLILWVRKKELVPFVLIAIGACLIFQITSSVIFPMMNITPGSERETLSLPFQQIARCVVEHEDGLTTEEITNIDKVLDYDSLAGAYSVDNADPVKGTYNEGANVGDLFNFFITWKELIQKYPTTCIEATLLQYHGYFYFSDEDNAPYTYSWSDHCMERADSSFNFHHLDCPITNLIAELGTAYTKTWQNIPILSLFTCSAFYSWAFILFLYIAATTSNLKKKFLWIPLVIYVLLLCIALLGPVNGSYYFRYMVPMALCFPFAISIILSALREDVSRT